MKNLPLRKNLRKLMMPKLKKRRRKD